MAENLPQRRSRRSSGENWNQFEFRDPQTEAAALSEIEASFRLKRGWNVDGAANVYFRTKATLAIVGQDVIQEHRFRHRRWRQMGAARHVRRGIYMLTACSVFLPTSIRVRCLSRGSWAR
jgi:hypothetical protein